MKRRSHVVVHTECGIAQWRNAPPSVDAARPAKCPECSCSSRPLGKPLNLLGHGLRQRSVYGPDRVDGKPELWSIDLRRYRCKRCRAIIEVVPVGVEAGRLYSRPGIAWALCLFGIERASTGSVADCIQPWRRVGATARRCWAQLRRWVRAIRDAALFPFVRRAPEAWNHRRVAERAAMTFASMAPPALRTATVGEQVWSGALQAR
jgi:hypothetical protein